MHRHNPSAGPVGRTERLAVGTLYLLILSAITFSVAPVSAAQSVGDIDLDGVAYQENDFIALYSNVVSPGYLEHRYGSQSLENADINGDGRFGTAADHVTFVRVYQGLPPVDQAASDTAVIVWNFEQQTIAVDYVEPIAALYIKTNRIPAYQFVGIDPALTFDLQSSDTRSGQSTSNHLLLGPHLVNEQQVFGPGLITQYHWESYITDFEVVTWSGHAVPAILTIEGACCFTSSGNIDFSPDGAITISDLTTLVQHFFEKPCIACLSQADVNGDSSLDIADLTRLVNYMFGGGPPLSACQ